MNQELLEQLYKKIEELEKKIELYYEMLKTENELSFILKGTYVLSSEIDAVLNGTYAEASNE